MKIFISDAGFKGDPGDPGPRGPDGEPGGLFCLSNRWQQD